MESKWDAIILGEGRHGNLSARWEQKESEIQRGTQRRRSSVIVHRHSAGKATNPPPSAGLCFEELSKQWCKVLTSLADCCSVVSSAARAHLPGASLTKEEVAHSSRRSKALLTSCVLFRYGDGRNSRSWTCSVSVLWTCVGSPIDTLCHTFF